MEVRNNVIKRVILLMVVGGTLLFLLLLVLLRGEEVGAQGPCPEGPSLPLGAEPIYAVLSADDPGFYVINSEYYISFPRYHAWYLQPPEDGLYAIAAASDERRVQLLLLRADHEILRVGERDRQRVYRRVITATLEGGVCYEVVVGGDEGTKYRLSAVRGEEIRLPPDRAVVENSTDLAEGVYRLEEGDLFFWGEHADYFLIPPSGREVRVHVSSADFDPILFVLDEEDNVIGFNNDATRGTTDAEIKIAPDVGAWAVVVSSYDGRLGEYHLALHAAWFDRLSALLQNPVWAFTLGILFSILLDFAPWKRRKGRCIVFEEEADQTILDPALQSVPLEINGKLVECAALYQVRVWSDGYERISKESLRDELRLRIFNITRVSSLAWEIESGEWLPPEIDPHLPNEIILRFDSLERGDAIRLCIVCEQVTRKGIFSRLSGRIAGGQIRETPQVLQSASLVLMNLFNLLFLIPLPVMWLNSLVMSLGGEPFIPYRVMYWFTWIWIAAMPVWFYFLLFTRRGRRGLFRAVRQIVVEDMKGFFAMLFRKRDKQPPTYYGEVADVDLFQTSEERRWGTDR